ncbi:hypothetical protein [Wandonia haliotis]
MKTIWMTGAILLVTGGVLSFGKKSDIIIGISKIQSQEKRTAEIRMSGSEAFFQTELAFNELTARRIKDIAIAEGHTCVSAISFEGNKCTVFFIEGTAKDTKGKALKLIVTHLNFDDFTYVND